MARKRAKDPREARVATDLEIEMDDKIRELEAEVKHEVKPRQLIAARAGK